VSRAKTSHSGKHRLIKSWRKDKRDTTTTKTKGEKTTLLQTPNLILIQIRNVLIFKKIDFNTVISHILYIS
jgi:tRNA G37 N-methylase TrmD